jgi:manganese efflux pump family protein
LSAAASFAWIATVLAGLVLLVIWLMEYDREFQSAAATRLPVPVISAHALLGIGGLLVWVLYLAHTGKRLAWVTVADLGVVAILGLVMAVRWIGVYRAYAVPGSAAISLITVPPERHFPRPVVIIHGILAVITVALVLFTVLLRRLFGSGRAEPSLRDEMGHGSCLVLVDVPDISPVG